MEIWTTTNKKDNNPICQSLSDYHLEIKGFRKNCEKSNSDSGPITKFSFEVAFGSRVLDNPSPSLKFFSSIFY